ncbi:MAG: winged helix-turn-helix domain-containing protein [Pseudomonadota bacterium]
MKDGPDIARAAALIGDPARANMLSALMDGRALTASELAAEAGVGLPTASAHLTRMAEGGLVLPSKQGRHRYFGLAGPEVAAALEALMGLAAAHGPTRTRPGPKDPALRRARICYDHLAGELGVALCDGLLARDWLSGGGEDLKITATGRAALSDFGLDIDRIQNARRPTCRTCLDWSARRSHLAGGLGAALLARMFGLGWARRESGSRVIRFSPRGEMALKEAFCTV